MTKLPKQSLRRTDLCFIVLLSSSFHYHCLTSIELSHWNDTISAQRLTSHIRSHISWPERSEKFKKWEAFSRFSFWSLYAIIAIAGEVEEVGVGVDEAAAGEVSVERAAIDPLHRHQGGKFRVKKIVVCVSAMKAQDYLLVFISRCTSSIPRTRAQSRF